MSRVIRASWVVLVVFAIASCSSKEDGGEVVVESPPPAPTLFASTVAVPAEVAAAKLGMTEAEAMAALGVSEREYPSKILERARYTLEMYDGKLVAITLVAKEALEEQLVKAWGPARFEIDGEQVWFDPKTQLHAWSSSRTSVTFSRAESLATVLGAKGFDLPFAAGKPLLDATVDVMFKTWGARLCRPGEVPGANEAPRSSAFWQLESVPSTEMQHPVTLCLPYALPGGSHHAHLELDDDRRVRAVALTFRTGGVVERAAEITAALATKLGPHVEVGTRHFHFDPTSHMRAVVAFAADSITVRIDRYLPLAELLGEGPSPVLPVETNSMIGGTMDQIRAENPRYRDKVGIVFPPTEFCDRPTELGFTTQSGRALSYMVVFPCQTEKVGMDAFRTLLQKKFGKGKRTDKDGTEDWTFPSRTRVIMASHLEGGWMLTLGKCPTAGCGTN